MKGGERGQLQQEHCSNVEEQRLNDITSFWS